MKKFSLIIAIIIFMFLLSINVSAKVGDIVGSIYSTDILAFINGVPVQAYNIGGKTVVILEDLREYGVAVDYLDKSRTLVVTMYWKPPTEHKQIERGTPGRIVGNIYETDIIVYVNAVPITAFSLNGRMAVAIEDLGRITDKSLEWSPYNMKCVWDSKERTISLYCLYENHFEVRDVIGDKPLSVRFSGDQIEIYIDYFLSISIGGSSRRLGFEPSLSFPIYCGEQRVGTGFKFFPVNWDINGGNVVVSNQYSIFYCYDIEALRNIIDDIVITGPTYEEVLEYYLNLFDIEVYDRIDTDDYSFLYMWQMNSHGGSDFLLWVDKDGNYRDFSNDIQSASWWGVMRFDAVTINTETETVTFSYNSIDYIIDLKTGTMAMSEQ